MFGMSKTLIVVYKDEMLVNQLKKMVETNDDKGEDQVVGTKDGSINIVSWSEKVWLANKRAGNIKDKVLFLGDIKGTDKLIPVIDVKFDEFGVRFGWAGNQAVLYADVKTLANREDYENFVNAIKGYLVPDMVKEPQKLKVIKDNTEEDSNSDSGNPKVETDKKNKPAIVQKAKKVIATGTEAVGKAGSLMAVKAEDALRDKNAVRQQMLFYGVVNLYHDGLEAFMNM